MHIYICIIYTYNDYNCNYTVIHICKYIHMYVHGTIVQFQIHTTFLIVILLETAPLATLVSMVITVSWFVPHLDR